MKPSKAPIGMSIDRMRNKELPAKAGKNLFKLSKMKSTVIYQSHLTQYQDYPRSPTHLKATNPKQSHPLQIGQ